MSPPSPSSTPPAPSPTSTRDSRGSSSQARSRGAAGDTCVLHQDGGRRIVAAGAGPRGQLDADAIRDAAAAVARLETGGTLAWLLDDSLPLSTAEQARAVVDGVVLGGYDQGRWKTGEPAKPVPERLVLVGDEDVREAAERAARVAEWANRARDLANRPPNDLTPVRLAERAAEIAAGSDALTCETLGLEQIRALGMGAFAGVAQGSHNPAQLIVLRYDPPAAPDGLVLGLVGKAITFDTGGISIKPALVHGGHEGRHGRRAAVIEAHGAIADLGLPVRVIAVVAGDGEHAVGGGAYRPGDILTAMNGKTIEVINTDAEGRLVLADALWYARQQGATHLLDLATLTGAMELALGDLYAGVFGNDDGWRGQVVEAGEASGDHAWPFPLHRRYRRYVDSNFADMKNASILRQGSPALAGEFLREFVGEGPWGAHRHGRPGLPDPLARRLPHPAGRHGLRRPADRRAAGSESLLLTLRSAMHELRPLARAAS